MSTYLLKIDLGGVRMDPDGSVWTRMGPYGPWGLPGGFLGPPGALGDPKRGRFLGRGDAQMFVVVVVVDGPPNHENWHVHEIIKKRSP